MRSVRDPLLLDPNAIVAAGPEQFYVANDSGATNAVDKATELLFRRGLSKIVYFDGRAMRSFIAGISECPPARSFASPPPASSSSIAWSTLSATS